MIYTEKSDARDQAMCKCSRQNNISIFIISQGYFEQPAETIRADGNICHIFRANIFGDVRNLYQDKASSDMTLNEFNIFFLVAGRRKINFSLAIWQKTNMQVVSV